MSPSAIPSPHSAVLADFRQRFGGTAPIVVRAPGRVNLIGEHTDYNDGFVLPMAIDRATWIALRPRTDRRVVLHSLDHAATLEFDCAQLTKQPKHWGEYPKGVAWALQEGGYELSGWEGTTACDVPMGAGLSSSASYELAIARAFQAVSAFPWEAAQMALLGQKAENKWVGVNCGIMDQMISAAGKEGHALLIDCRSLDRQLVPLPAHTAVVILDTSTRRGLVDSKYNERRAQCEAAARFFGVKALRDVSVAQFEQRAGELAELTRRRARHVVTENERTLRAADLGAAAEPATTNAAAEFGRLMNASHESLRDDFEVTNLELDIIVQCARQAPGCYGARMTGAGFGGCAVALVATPQVEAFVKTVATSYAQTAKRESHIYVCRATNGAELIG